MFITIEILGWEPGDKKMEPFHEYESWQDRTRERKVYCSEYFSWQREEGEKEINDAVRHPELPCNNYIARFLHNSIEIEQSFYKFDGNKSKLKNINAFLKNELNLKKIDVFNDGNCEKLGLEEGWTLDKSKEAETWTLIWNEISEITILLPSLHAALTKKEAEEILHSSRAKKLAGSNLNPQSQSQSVSQQLEQI